MIPLVRAREKLKQQPPELNGQVPRDPDKANQIEQRIEDCNQEINQAVEPSTKFTEDVKNCGSPGNPHLGSCLFPWERKSSWRSLKISPR